MLTEPILVLETEGGNVAATLPEALGRLCDGGLHSFDGLAAHQRHAWGLFLYQLAALALVRSDAADAAEDDAAWRALADPQGWWDRLAALTPGCTDTAWSLVVDDPAKPAFLQPPIGSGRLDRYDIVGRTPDEIDVLVTAKGHDVKAARASSAEPRHWLFALVSLQTQQGYSGRGNFGIARMNGGFASRPMLMLTPRRDLASCFRRGVQAALAARAQALASFAGHYRADGRALLWLESWDTETSLPLADLDPLFIEICRRIRLAHDSAGRIIAFGRPSEVARVAVPKESKGNLGDAFTPINLKEGAALTVSSAGFDYQLLRRLLGDEFKRPAAMQPPANAPVDGMLLHAAVLVRGQGKTEGLHERWLPVPRKAIVALGAPSIGKLSTAMAAQADEAKKALRMGLLNFLQGGPSKVDFKDERPRAWLEVFEQQVDDIFFANLFDRLANLADESREAAWKQALGAIARDLFDQATARLSPPECRRERAYAVAALTFGGMLNKAGLGRSHADDNGQEDADTE